MRERTARDDDPATTPRRHDSQIVEKRLGFRVKMAIVLTLGLYAFFASSVLIALKVFFSGIMALTVGLAIHFAVKNHRNGHPWSDQAQIGIFAVCILVVFWW